MPLTKTEEDEAKVEAAKLVSPVVVGTRYERKPRELVKGVPLGDRIEKESVEYLAGGGGIGYENRVFVYKGIETWKYVETVTGPEASPPSSRAANLHEFVNVSETDPSPVIIGTR